jgi:GST-like protein
MDHSGETPVRVFESGAILMHLAEKFGAFLGRPEDRPEMLSWLFWQMGSAPYLGGGFGHFYAYAPYPMEYPINRFAMETKRQLDVLNRHLEGRTWMVGDDITIADMAIAPWYGRTVMGESYGAGEFLSVHEYTNVIAWAERFYARPAVQRGSRVNRTSDTPGEVPERTPRCQRFRRARPAGLGGGVTPPPGDAEIARALMRLADRAARIEASARPRSPVPCAMIGAP